jgi:hypothetical protein
MLNYRGKHTALKIFSLPPQVNYAQSDPIGSKESRSDLCCELSESFQSDSDRRIRPELHTTRSNPCHVLSDSDEIRRNPGRNPTERIA